MPLIVTRQKSLPPRAATTATTARAEVETGAGAVTEATMTTTTTAAGAGAVTVTTVQSSTPGGYRECARCGGGNGGSGGKPASAFRKGYRVCRDCVNAARRFKRSGSRDEFLTKPCAMCGVIKPVKQFEPLLAEGSPDGRGVVCASCVVGHVRKWRSTEAYYMGKNPDVPGTELLVKTCKRCGENKPIGKFYHNPQYRDGLDTVCRCCRRVVKKRENPLGHDSGGNGGRKMTSEEREEAKRVLRRVLGHGYRRNNRTPRHPTSAPGVAASSWRGGGSGGGTISSTGSGGMVGGDASWAIAENMDMESVDRVYNKYYRNTRNKEE